MFRIVILLLLLRQPIFHSGLKVGSKGSRNLTADWPKVDEVLRFASSVIRSLQEDLTILRYPILKRCRSDNVRLSWSGFNESGPGGSGPGRSGPGRASFYGSDV